ncbi:MAG: hypothetical protein PHR78_01910 [Eubacteriales bacterium]|nr:hypothetical protein [Eubacteriales bacterium]MDD4324264.1 hypothetical protein [Eubacteriales bacterium]MDD4540908.1 hypothetical protein [Eubacteriales bacterium]
MNDKENNHREYRKTPQADLMRNFDEQNLEDTLLQSKTAQMKTLRARKYTNANSIKTENMNTDFLTRGLENKNSLETERKLGHRIYRLKGYTTVDKVNRKYQQQKYQRTLQNVLTTLMIAIVLIILFVLYNPFKDKEEWKKITGMDSFLEETESSETLPDEGLPNILP